MKHISTFTARVIAICTISAATIGASALLIQGYLSPPMPEQVSLTGTVIDQRTNSGIGQALVSVLGRPEQYVTKDNGNFRVRVFTEKTATIQVHVFKAGYHVLDKTVQLPIDGLTLQLRRQ
jgi:hypothetical protein